MSRPSCIRKQLQLAFAPAEIEYTDPKFAYMPLPEGHPPSEYQVHSRYLSSRSDQMLSVPAFANLDPKLEFNLDVLPTCFGGVSGGDCTSPPPWFSPAEWQYSECGARVGIESGERVTFVVQHSATQSSFTFLATKCNSSTSLESAWVPERTMVFKNSNGVDTVVPSYPSLETEFPRWWKRLTKEIFYPTKYGGALVSNAASADLQFARVTPITAVTQTVLPVFCLLPTSLLPCTYEWVTENDRRLFHTTVVGAEQLSLVTTQIDRLPAPDTGVKTKSQLLRSSFHMSSSTLSSSASTLVAAAAAAESAGSRGTSRSNAALSTSEAIELTAFPFVVLPVHNNSKPGAAHPMDRDPARAGCCSNCDLDPVFMRGSYMLPIMITILRILASQPLSQGMYVKALAKAALKSFSTTYPQVDNALRSHLKIATWASSNAKLTIFIMITTIRFMESIGLLRLQADFSHPVSDATTSAWIEHALSAQSASATSSFAAQPAISATNREGAGKKQLNYAPNMVFAEVDVLDMLIAMNSKSDVRSHTLVICPRYLLLAFCRSKSKSALKKTNDDCGDEVVQDFSDHDDDDDDDDKLNDSDSDGSNDDGDLGNDADVNHDVLNEPNGEDQADEMQCDNELEGDEVDDRGKAERDVDVVMSSNLNWTLQNLPNTTKYFDREDINSGCTRAEVADSNNENLSIIQSSVAAAAASRHRKPETHAITTGNLKTNTAAASVERPSQHWWQSSRMCRNFTKFAAVLLLCCALHPVLVRLLY